MKKKFLISIQCVLSIVFFFACDVIGEKDGYTETYSSALARKVLLEEYTAMRCVNCPAAAEVAKLLQEKETFGDSLIVVAIHASNLAVPSGIFQPDLRTEAGNIYFKDFGFAGTPMGMVNRKKHAGSLVLNSSGWAAAVEAAGRTSSDIRVGGEVIFTQEGGGEKLHCAIHISGLPSAGENKLTLWLVEDGIITPQTISGGVEQKYVQRHVLREALNGTWGETINADKAQEWNGTRIYDLRSDINVGQCTIVAFVTESSSNEIVAVEQIPVNVNSEVSSISRNKGIKKVLSI